MTYAIGPDVSRYNKQFNPTAASGPIDFVFQKATEGTSYVDLEYENIWQGVKQIPVRGAYHYQRSGMSWLAQADHFLETTRKHVYHIHALDLEEFNNIYTDTFFADSKRIIDYWKKNAHQKVVLYTNGSTYAQMYIALARLFGQAYAAAYMDGLDFWLASPAEPGKPFVPKYRGTPWTFHQYAWDGAPSRWGTGGTRCDENVFNGDLMSLYAWLGAIVAPEPPTEPGEIMPTRYEAINTYGMSRRPAPNVDNAPLLPSISAQSKIHGNNLVGQQGSGNCWLEIVDVGGAPSSGFVAIEHNGRVYCTLTDNQPPTPEPLKVPDYLIAYFGDGTSKKYLPE